MFLNNLLKASIMSMIVLMFHSAVLYADYGTVRELIDKGDLAGAERELNNIISESFTDWEGAYLKGVLQADGDLSIADLEKALLLCKQDCEEVVVDLISAYYAYSDYEKVIEIYDEYEGFLDNDQKTFRSFWLTSLAYLQLGEYDQAEDIIREVSDEDEIQKRWSEVARAVCEYEDDKNDAVKRLNGIIGSGGVTSQAALFLKIYFRSLEGNSDDVMSGFLMLKEINPDFIGSYELLAYLENGSYRNVPDGSAEKITGVRYTIQLGTYSNKSEASELMNKLQKDGWTCFENSRFIDGRKYWVISVGAFATVEKAQKTKKILEDMLNGSFQVVILE